MQKRFGFGFATVALALLAAAHSNVSDDLVYHDSITNGIIKRHPAEQLPSAAHWIPLAPVATVKLSRNKKDTSWLVTTEVGTPRPKRPQQFFNVIPDTGSPYFWVTSSGTSRRARKPGHYNPRLSSSWQDLHGTFKASYTAGSVEGGICSDVVNVGGMKVEMTCGSVTKRSKGVVEDGILGLSLSASPTLSESHFFHVALKQYPFFNPVAAFCFGTRDPELHLGQVKEVYLGEIEYHKVAGKSSISGTTIVADIRTIFDTGARSIFGPPDEVDKIYQKIPNRRRLKEKHGQMQYIFPCKQKPQISFRWKNGNPWMILPEQWVTSLALNLMELIQDNSLAIRIPGDDYWCKGAIVGEVIPYDENPETLWLVGDIVMWRRYVIFNAKDQLVGLAEAKEGCTH
ncbi:hypothetical protein APHAL10511_000687 [Amanita phalloides]|nr:hypothetical protein APHAL10511_000687 [Amanita phalloides]